MAFVEVQRIDQIWLKILYGISTGIALFVTAKQTLESGKASDAYFLIGFFLFLVAIYALVFQSNAQTRIDTQGISYKYWPIVPAWKMIKWQDISKIEVKGISPISDYGGWGYRFGKKGRGIILNEHALIIHRKEAKPFVLSTAKATLAKNEIERYHAELLE